jgi:adenylate kinase
VNEYREKRGLTPLRLLVQGPPVSGKTTLSKQLASYYGLHYISMKDVVDNAEKIVSQLVIRNILFQ